MPSFEVSAAAIGLQPSRLVADRSSGPFEVTAIPTTPSDGDIPQLAVGR
jgi:hypothetical protein